MIFKNVTQEHIIQGIKDFEEKGLPNGYGPSSTYDLSYEGKRYPPKAIMAYANYHAEGRTIEPYFRGGEGTDCFKKYDELDFDIVPKNNESAVHNLLISEYKRVIKTYGYDDEIYKWELIEKNEGRPDINADDFTVEINSLDFTNLIFYNALRVSRHLASEKETDYRKLYISLFDENQPLQERINQFSVNIETLYRNLQPEGDTAPHHHDERTIATFLTYKYPNRYTFYKSTYYKNLCNKLKIKPKPAGEKYVHYLSLLNNFIDEYISKDSELIQLVEEIKPETIYKDPNKLLLAQDILYRTLEKDYKTDDKADKAIGLISSDGTGWFEYHIEHSANSEASCIWSSKKPTKTSKTLNDLGKLLQEKGSFPYYFSSAKHTTYKANVIDFAINQKALDSKTWTDEYDNIYSYHKNFSDYVNENLKASIIFLIDKLEKVESIPVDDFQFAHGAKAPRQDNISPIKSIPLLKEPNYWLFQGNPSIYNITKALNANHLKSWKVAAHKDKIKIGDKVIIWQTGSNACCCALAEVTSEVGILPEEDVELKYYENQSESTNDFRVQLKILENISNHPIPYEVLVDWNAFEKFNAGNQGTNFKATKEQFDFISSFIKDQKLLLKTISLNSPQTLQYYFQTLDGFITGHGITPKDEKVTFNISERTLKFIVSQRFCWNLYPENHNKGLFGIITDKKIDGFSEEFEGGEPQLFHIRVSNSEIVDENISHIKTAINYQYDVAEKSGFRKYLNYAFLATVFNNEYRSSILTTSIETMEESNKQNLKTFTLNQILYGPPGTGKTYNTILKAAQIVSQNENLNYNEAQTIFNENLGNQIEFITFHQNYSYEDFIQGLRPDVEASGELSFFKSDGVFKKISDRALKNYKESNTRVHKKRSFAEVFEEFILPLVEGEVEEIEIEMRKVSFFITNVKDKSIEFRKTSGGTGHTLSIGTLEEMYNQESTSGIKGLASYYRPLLEELLEKGKLNETESITRKNYVIIIDEINRANISRVFGELITLIEKDKRYGGKIPLTATLPSGEKFIVPSNLYIIGTMNTADKSVALLDIALRRRFEFVPMYPDYNISGINDVVILEKINNEIISRKGHDFTIGHSYFMGDNYNRKNTINNKVIPLLLEYFMNDVDVIEAILKAAEITVGNWPLQMVVND